MEKMATLNTDEFGGGDDKNQPNQPSNADTPGPPPAAGDRDVATTTTMELNIQAEEQNLLKLFQDAHRFFTHVLYQKNATFQKLSEVSNRIFIAGYQNVFLVRLRELHRVAGELESEVGCIRDQLNVLYFHQQTLAACNAVKRQRTPPDMTQTRINGFRTLDRIVALQSLIGNSVMIPLGNMEWELHGLMFRQATPVSAVPYQQQQVWPWPYLSPSQSNQGTATGTPAFAFAFAHSMVSATPADPHTYGYTASASTSPPSANAHRFNFGSSTYGYNNTSGMSYYSSIHATHGHIQGGFNGGAGSGVVTVSAEAQASGNDSQPQEQVTGIYGCRHMSDQRRGTGS